MIESRPLTRQEFYKLFKDAPDSEIKGLAAYCAEYDLDPYEFLNRHSFEHFGILNDERPLYFGALTQTQHGNYCLWTIANKDIKEQFSLYKLSKRKVHDLLSKYKIIYATMDKGAKKNIEWAVRMNFKTVSENMLDNTVTLCLKGG